MPLTRVRIFQLDEQRKLSKCLLNVIRDIAWCPACVERSLRQGCPPSEQQSTSTPGASCSGSALSVNCKYSGFLANPSLPSIVVDGKRYAIQAWPAEKSNALGKNEDCTRPVHAVIKVRCGLIIACKPHKTFMPTLTRFSFNWLRCTRRVRWAVTLYSSQESQLELSFEWRKATPAGHLVAQIPFCCGAFGEGLKTA